MRERRRVERVENVAVRYGRSVDAIWASGATVSSVGDAILLKSA